MTKRAMGVAVGLLAVVLAILISPTASSQMDAGQPVYTYVSEFQVPRAHWAAFAEDEEKSFLPVVEKGLADGTLVAYSTFENLVHTPEGLTNGATWSSTSIAGVLKTLDELRKGGPRAGQVASTKHEDFFMVSTLHHGTTVANGTGYLRVICSNAKAEKPAEYLATMKKLLVPTFEEQFKKGVATYYGIDEQYVNTMAPSERCVVVMYPNAESVDKWAVAINATLGKMSPAEREEYARATVLDSRRDLMARVTHQASK
jgi:hypothetical protein